MANNNQCHCGIPQKPKPFGRTWSRTPPFSPSRWRPGATALLSPLRWGGGWAGPLLWRGALSRPGAGSFGGINQALGSVRSRQGLTSVGIYQASLIKSNVGNNRRIFSFSLILPYEQRQHHSREMLDEDPRCSLTLSCSNIKNLYWSWHKATWSDWKLRLRRQLV